MPKMAVLRENLFLSMKHSMSAVQMYSVRIIETHKYTIWLRGAESSWDAKSLSAIEEIPRILWNQNLHYLVYKSRTRVPTLSQINPFHASHPIYLRCNLLLLSCLCLGLTVVFFLQPSPLKSFVPYVSHVSF
jgi:hypothetical protein